MLFVAPTALCDIQRRWPALSGIRRRGLDLPGVRGPWWYNFDANVMSRAVRGRFWTMMRVLGWKNEPWRGRHRKYLTPLTEPSFLPTDFGKMIPIQMPGLNF